MRTFSLVVALLAVACIKQSNAMDQKIAPQEACSSPEQYTLNLASLRLPDPNIEETRILVYDERAHAVPVFHGIDLRSNGRLHMVACLAAPDCLGDLCPDKLQCCDLGLERIEH